MKAGKTGIWSGDRTGLVVRNAERVLRARGEMKDGVEMTDLVHLEGKDVKEFLGESGHRKIVLNKDNARTGGSAASLFNLFRKYS